MRAFNVGRLANDEMPKDYPQSIIKLRAVNMIFSNLHLLKIHCQNHYQFNESDSIEVFITAEKIS
jgi:hypothetical protein